MAFNLGALNDAISAAIPDRVAVVHGERRVSYKDLAAESRQFAAALTARGFGAHRERAQLEGHESGQDHLAVYLHNSVEYLTGMLGSFKARVAPVNVNYRYVADELRYLLLDSGSRIVMYHDRFAPTLAEVLRDIDTIELLIQVPDDTDADLLAGAIRYDAFLMGGDPASLTTVPSPDDLYILYTGGTTGMPKGVLWRQHDIFISAMGGRPFGAAEPFDSLEAVVAASVNGGTGMLTAAPLMHGAAQWMAFICFTGGGSVVLSPDPTRFDAAQLLETAVRERVVTLQVVGDAMARPIVEEIECGGFDLSGLFALANGGAALSPGVKGRFLDAVPHAVVVDGVGSSETGAQMGHTSTKGAASTGTFTPGPETVIVDAGLKRILDPSEDEVGWLAQCGHVPLGYLGDADKTAATFPVIDGQRLSVPGDRARWVSDGMVELLGRDSMTINSGGEKVFVEEVEQAVLCHPSVVDVMVVGRTDERWGETVVALVQLAPDSSATAEDIVRVAAERVARYKLPRDVIFKDALVRSPAGKADYRWARAAAAATTSSSTSS